MKRFKVRVLRRCEQIGHVIVDAEDEEEAADEALECREQICWERPHEEEIDVIHVWRMLRKENIDND